MSTADCLSDEQIAAYAAGDGSLADAESIDSHLENCSRCRDRLDELSFEPGFLANVRAAAREESQDNGSSPSADSVDDESAQSPTTFPKIPGYRIRREVGRGGMGVVFEAIQTKLNRLVALKVLPPMLAKISTTAVKRFRAEASAAARLHHNNIIPIYDFGEFEGAYFYAMELIEGEPLHKVIQSLATGDPLAGLPTQLIDFLPSKSSMREGRSADSAETNAGVRPGDGGSAGSSSTAISSEYYRQVAHWIRDVADALHHAHTSGVIHRDIKPANLILARDGRMMVADFGLAKCTDTESVTMTGSLVGTWRYMSPEQALAKRMPVDHRTDIYSLAVTMYELLTFRHAFPGSDGKEIISKVITQEPIRPRKIIRSVPAELETICLKGMEKSRDARYDTAAAFADEFRRYLNDLPIIAKPPGPIVRMRKFAKRHRGAASMCVATALFLASVAGLFYTKHVEERRERARVETAVEQGNIFMKQANWRAAEDRYNLARRLDPKNIEAIGNLARAKKEQYNSMSEPDLSLLEEANRLCDEALRLDTQRSHHPRLLNLKGVVLKKLYQFDAAIEAFLQSRAFDETDSAPVINLGPLYALKKNLAEASRWLELGVRMLSDRSEAVEGECAPLYHNLGALLLYQGNATATEHLATSHDCNRGFPPNLTLRARACLELGGCGDQFDARRFAEIADYIANTNAQRAKAKRILALAYVRDRAYEGAVREATAAIVLGDLETVDHLILAVAHAELGEHRMARTHLQHARDTWPVALDEPGEYTVEAPAGFLWFESADQLFDLRAEVEALLNVSRP